MIGQRADALAMVSGDQYRERAEEYETINCAMPKVQKFGEYGDDA